MEVGSVKLVRFDSSPQCYRRDAKLVSKAGSDEFMFDFQRRGRSSMAQAGNEGTIEPGYGVLYDARRPFEDRLDGPEQRSEVLIATVPAATLLRMFPQAERLCATTRAAVRRHRALDRRVHSCQPSICRTRGQAGTKPILWLIYRPCFGWQPATITGLPAPSCSA